MSVKLPNGSTMSIATAYKTAKPVTAATNATETVLTLDNSTNPLAIGDLVEVTSGWTYLSNKIARIKAQTATTVTLEGMDTTDLIKYPAGSGVGSVRAINGLTQIAQITDVATSGGEQQYATYSFLEENAEHQMPTIRSAQTMTLTIGDDTSLPHYALLTAATDDRAPRALVLALASGSKVLYNCYVSLGKTPSLTKNEIMTLSCSLAMLNDPVRYAA